MSNIMRKVNGYEYTESNELHTKLTFINLECGHRMFLRYGHDNTNMPLVYECDECGDVEAKHAQLKQWIDSGIVAYTRAKPRYDTIGVTRFYTVYIYRREPTSPTGVLLLGTVPDIPEFADLLHGSLSPLSPNER